MRRILTDIEVATLVAETKQLPSNWRNRLRLRRARFGSHRESDLELEGDNGSQFKLIIKENPNLPNDFTVILVYYDDTTTARWRLKRYNSSSSFPHTNRIEYRKGYPGSRFEKKFHIHTCTKRYQLLGYKEDHYAETTDSYSDLDGAILCLLKDCNFMSEAPIDDIQTKLFGE